jgi:hypothetical protein
VQRTSPVCTRSPSLSYCAMPASNAARAAS